MNKRQKRKHAEPEHAHVPVLRKKKSPVPKEPYPKTLIQNSVKSKLIGRLNMNLDLKFKLKYIRYILSNSLYVCLYVRI